MDVPSPSSAWALQPSSADVPHPEETQWRERWFHAFDTECFVKARATEHDLDQVVSLCARYERLLSHTLPGSDIWAVNHAEGRRTKVDPETAALVREALRYCSKSSGLFDITLAPLARLWNFHTACAPSEGDVARALRHVGWQRVDATEDTVVVTDPEAEITLGGIAKGYIADRVRDILVDQGVRDAFISLGGNVVVMGRSPHDRLWNIGVRSPDFHRDQERERIENEAIARSPHGIDKRALRDLGRRPEKPACVLTCSDLSVVTSGIYERCFLNKATGTVHHHILGPKTGRPCESDLASATVLSRTSIEGDGLSTALIIMGCDRAAAFIREQTDAAALFIRRDGSAAVSGNKEILKETRAIEIAGAVVIS
ncbi:FAD:protein FMN transferase [Ellagibacter isourolithinifaciens]